MMKRQWLWYVLPASVVLGAFVACADDTAVDDPSGSDGGASSTSASSSSSSGVSASSTSSSSSSSSSGSPDNSSSGDVDSGNDSGAPDADADAPDADADADAGSDDASDDAGDAGGDADAALPMTAKPTFTTNPTTGPFTTPVQVSIASATPNAAIYYTLDGTNPTTASAHYTVPLVVTETTSIHAFAIAPGDSASDVASTLIIINSTSGCCTDTVTFTPSDNIKPQPNAFPVALSYSVANATICYTTDGLTTPSCTSGVCTGGAQTYNAAAPIPIAQTQTALAALACKANSTNSSVTTKTYRLQAADVSVNPPAGAMAGPVDVMLSSATVGSTIHYTTNGGAVTCATGTATASPATVHLTTTTTLTTIACKTGFEASNSNAFTYTLH